MKSKLGFLAMLAVVAASFTACCDFPVDPFPPDNGGPIDTVGTGWPDDGGGCGGGDTVIIEPWPDDSLGIKR